MNAKLRQKGKSNFQKELFKLMKIAVLGKTMENVRKCGDIKLFSIRTKLSYYNFFFRKFISSRN